MPFSSECIFCEIVTGVIPASVVYQDSAVLAFLDIAPLAEGHLLVVPKRHFDKLIDLPPTLAAELGGVMPMLARVLLQTTRADGFNILQNDGRAAGQVVSHVHFHLIPRKSGDNLGYRWSAGQYSEGRAATIADAFRQSISDGHV